MGRCQKNFEEHDREILDFLEQTISRNTGVKDSAVRCQGEAKSTVEKNLYSLKESLNWKYADGREMNFESTCREGLEGHEEHVFGNWGKGVLVIEGRKRRLYAIITQKTE